MAVDKLVDSAQLDADLTAVANAIRTKGGTSAALAFPNGFVDAIDAIETGGGGALQSGSFTLATDSNTFSVELSSPATHFLFYNEDYPTNGLNVGFWTFAGWWLNNASRSFQIYNDGTANFACNPNASTTLTGNTLTFATGTSYKVRHEKTYVWFAW